MSDKIPSVGSHRGVELHDMQGSDRLDLVCHEIDAVIGMSDIAELFAWAKDVGRAPESRLLAGAKAEAILEGVGLDRQKRPAGLSIELVKAHTAGLDSVGWRSSAHYGSLLCTPSAPGMPGMVKRENRLPDR